MASPSSVYDPKVVFHQLKSTRETFEQDWSESVKQKVKMWTGKKQPSDVNIDQLEWSAHVVQYVTYIYDLVQVHKNSKNKSTIKLVPKDTPLLGPHFSPPSYIHRHLREALPTITPTPMYFRPLHQEEMAIGYQLRCDSCNREGRKHCLATTSHGLPIFFHKSAFTRALFDLIIELRPRVTSAGVAAIVEQQHLREYHARRLHYYFEQYRNRRQRSTSLTFFQAPLKERGPTAFSECGDPQGYSGASISSDLVSEVFLQFASKTRQEESSDMLRTIEARHTMSLDATFRAAGKVALVDSDQRHTKILKGGVLSALTDDGLILTWRFCISGSFKEMSEMLVGYRMRCEALGTDPPALSVVDNCCTVGAHIKEVFPDTHVCLDVWHFLMRYLAVIVDGTRNPCRVLVARDITAAILKNPASATGPAEYFDSADQVKNMDAMFLKWEVHGSVWSMAATKVHQTQMGHVRKGCLSRPGLPAGVAADGSRIEASHKGWNSLQRAFSSGLPMMNALCHDFVLRRNMRILWQAGSSKRSTFVQSTQGSHHIRLVSHANAVWNLIKSPESTVAPVLRIVDSGERFGLVQSKGHFADLSYPKPGYILAVDGELALSRALAPSLIQKGAPRDRWSARADISDLAAALYALARYLGLACTVVFVFDGPLTSSLKRKTIITPTNDKVKKAFRKLIRAVGFHIFDAKGEADADLGRMSRYGFVNGVVSDASDVFIFGAKMVIRTPNLELDGEDVHTFRAVDIRRHKEYGLDSVQLILFAVLMGNDYDQDGLSGCGLQAAISLARSYLATELIEILDAAEAPEFWHRKDQFRAAIHDEIMHNTSHLLCHPLPNVAENITSSIPNMDTVRLLARPISSDLCKIQAASEGWNAQDVDIGRLAELSVRYFGWDFDTVRLKFEEHLYRGICIQYLVTGRDQRHTRMQNRHWSLARCDAPFPSSPDASLNCLVKVDMASVHTELIEFGLSDLVAWSIDTPLVAPYVLLLVPSILVLRSGVLIE
ncbi:hypothetical protein GGF50DRAFT_120901 [Schizophyllum commune]